MSGRGLRLRMNEERRILPKHTEAEALRTHLLDAVRSCPRDRVTVEPPDEDPDAGNVVPPNRASGVDPPDIHRVRSLVEGPVQQLQRLDIAHIGQTVAVHVQMVDVLSPAQQPEELDGTGGPSR